MLKELEARLSERVETAGGKEGRARIPKRERRYGRDGYEGDEWDMARLAVDSGDILDSGHQDDNVEAAIRLMI